MRVLLPAFFCYLALALQATFVPYLGIADIQPDLPLIAVVLLALSRGAAAGTVAGFLVGLAQDLTNPAFLGLNALAMCLLGWAVGSLRGRFDAGTALSYAAALAVSTLSHDALVLTVYKRLVLSEIFSSLATRTLPTALYTAVVGAGAGIVFLSMRRSQRLGRSHLQSR